MKLLFLQIALHELRYQTQAFPTEKYSQNAVCRENNCVNPIFPGMNDLARLEVIDWQCTDDIESMRPHMAFCGDVINYRANFPSPNITRKAESALVKSQDDAAATMFFYHMNALGYDAWELQNPGKSRDSCVRAAWRMICYTYFPKSQPGCRAGQMAVYLRPCKSCCNDYLRACQVECCDESPQCVFEHYEKQNETHALLSTGYYDAEGPSAACTGMGSSSAWRTAPLKIVAFLLMLGLQANSASDAGGSDHSARRTRRSSAGVARRYAFGIVVLVAALAITPTRAFDMEIGHHNVGNWRAKPDYLSAYEFVPPGKSAQQAELNSCSAAYPETTQCSGRGFCKAWNPTEAVSLAFCSCDRDWADPECKTRRKSQVKVFFISLFGGIFGLDYFYLGFPMWGLAKLCTLGGVGFWWLFDIVRMGSGPVYAYNYRVAADLPHALFVICVIFFFMVLGFAGAMMTYFSLRNKKRKDIMMHMVGEESRSLPEDDAIRMGPQFKTKDSMQDWTRHGFSGYGATIPRAMPNAAAPFATPMEDGQQGPYAGPYGPFPGEPAKM